MALWWIGNAVLAFVVAPLVILLANRLVRRALEVKRYADDVLEHGVALTGALDDIPKLVTTKELTGAAVGLVGRYGAALTALQGAPGRESRPLRAAPGGAE